MPMSLYTLQKEACSIFCLSFLKNIDEETFGQSPEQKKEFARLTSISGLALGRGESACMVYCRYNHDVVGSSNVSDVTAYCTEHGITYLTTNDFLYYGISRGIITNLLKKSF